MNEIIIKIILYIYILHLYIKYNERVYAYTPHGVFLKNLESRGKFLSKLFTEITSSRILHLFRLHPEIRPQKYLKKTRFK